jgi:hypothetical protein
MSLSRESGMSIAPGLGGGILMTVWLLALEWTYLGIGTAVVVLLMGLLLLPFLIKANRDGKKELGPLRQMKPGGGVTLGGVTTPGVGDNNPGRVGDPAPGQPDAQPDPYGARAQRHGTPIKS